MAGQDDRYRQPINRMRGWSALGGKERSVARMAWATTDHLRYWSLAHSPFRHPAAGHFFAGHPQREAIARLHLLVASDLGLGLLRSSGGCGTTTLMRYLAASHGWGDCAVQVIYSRGDQPEAGQVWHDLALKLRLGEPGPDVAARVRSAMVADSRQSVRNVWLVDEADQAAAEVAADLLDQVPRFATVLAVREMGPMVPDRQLAVRVGRCPLRLELPPWSLGDSIDYVREMLRRCGGRREIFTDVALVRLHEVTEGRVAAMSGLAETALALAASRGETQVGVGVVEEVEERLVRAA